MQALVWTGLLMEAATRVEMVMGALVSLDGVTYRGPGMGGVTDVGGLNTGGHAGGGTSGNGVAS